MTARRTRRSDLAVAGGLFTATLAVLLSTARSIGYARDEGFYFVAANAYGRWLRLLVQDPGNAVSAAVVDLHWGVNHEHPPLLKTLFALSHEVLGQGLHVFASEGTSYRFPAMVSAALLVALLYLWGTRVAGRAAGVVAAATFLAMPRVFFHAHLACFDVPVTALFTATTFAWWRSLERKGLRWPLACALLFGATLSAKHNAWFLPILFAAHTAALAVGAAVGGRGAWRTARRPLAILGAALAIGPVVLWISWPWIWRDTAARVGEYVAFHLHHDFYNMEFLGQTYWRPPFPRTYAPLMTLATVPATTLVLAASGLGPRLWAGLRALARRDGPDFARHRVFVLWLGAILIGYGPWTGASTPIFGGTKHWLTAYPFIALFAGVGFAAAVARLRRALGPRSRPTGGRGLAAALALVVVAPGAATTARAHPWGLTSYTPLVGGPPGAATLGLNRTFWGYTTASAAPWLEANAPAEARVYPHDTLGAAWDRMVQGGILRRDLRRTGNVAGADVALQHHEMHMQGQEYQAWIALGTTRPGAVLGPDGVPVLLVYRRSGRARPVVGEEEVPPEP